jgi:hypothetical protein
MSNGTLILHLGALDGGTLLTVNTCERDGKPCLVIQLDSSGNEEDVSRIRNGLKTTHIRTLNVAGPRESKRPGAYQAASQFLDLVSGGQ